MLSPKLENVVAAILAKYEKRVGSGRAKVHVDRVELGLLLLAARGGLNAAVARREEADRPEVDPRLAAAAPILLRNLELALEWLDNVLTDWPHEQMEAPRGRRLAVVEALIDALPNNWRGRLDMREAIGEATGKTPRPPKAKKGKREWHGCVDPLGHTLVEGVCQTPGCTMDLRLASEKPGAAGLSGRDIEEFNAYLRQCTDAQVAGVYRKELAAGRGGYAALAVGEAVRRGMVMS